MKFRDNILLFTLTPLIVLFIGASYMRFIVIHDYMVEYEGECDPATNTCFVGCEDEECTTEYYYSKIQKYAPDIFAQCGADITDCENANVCLDGENKCSITLCDPETDGEECELLDENDFLESIEETVTENAEVETEQPNDDSLQEMSEI